jgi:ABC-type antimicrobial peptide transport system permease subunit
MALGARPRDIFGLVVQHGLGLAVAGLVLGLLGAAALTRLAARQLHGVSATDPATFVGVAGILVAVALLACAVPASRASRVDPMRALRHD